MKWHEIIKFVTTTIFEHILENLGYFKLKRKILNVVTGKIYKYRIEKLSFVKKAKVKYFKLTDKQSDIRSGLIANITVIEHLYIGELLQGNFDMEKLIKNLQSNGMLVLHDVEVNIKIEE